MFQFFPLSVQFLIFLHGFSHFEGAIGNSLIYQLAELFTDRFNLDTAAVEPGDKTENLVY